MSFEECLKTFKNYKLAKKYVNITLNYLMNRSVGFFTYKNAYLWYILNSKGFSSFMLIGSSNRDIESRDIFPEFINIIANALLFTTKIKELHIDIDRNSNLNSLKLFKGQSVKYIEELYINCISLDNFKYLSSDLILNIKILHIFIRENARDKINAINQFIENFRESLNANFDIDLIEV